MERSESFKEIATALAKAQAAMHGATKDGKNPAFKSQYATLASVIEAARGPLTENGIAFLQTPGVLTPEGLPITTTLMHCSGEWVSSTLVMPVQKRDPQGIGSVITYGCRYSLMSLLGLPPVDDDGEAAMDRTPQRPAPRLAPPKASVSEPSPFDDEEDTDPRSASQRIADEQIAIIYQRPTAGSIDSFRSRPAVNADFAVLEDEDKERVEEAVRVRKAELAPPTLMAGE